MNGSLTFQVPQTPSPRDPFVGHPFGGDDFFSASDFLQLSTLGCSFRVPSPSSWLTRAPSTKRTFPGSLFATPDSSTYTGLRRRDNKFFFGDPRWGPPFAQLACRKYALFLGRTPPPCWPSARSRPFGRPCAPQTYGEGWGARMIRLLWSGSIPFFAFSRFPRVPIFSGWRIKILLRAPEAVPVTASLFRAGASRPVFAPPPWVTHYARVLRFPQVPSL